MTGKIERILIHSKRVNIFVNGTNFILEREKEDNPDYEYPNFNALCGLAVAAAFNKHTVKIHHGDENNIFSIDVSWLHDA